MTNPFESISRANDVISNAVSVMATKKERIIKSFVNAFLLVVIFAVFGVLDFATLTLHLEQLGNPDFWGSVFTKVVGGVCAYNIGMNIMWDTELKKDKILEESIKYYNRLIKYKRMDFQHFVDKVFNPKLKRLAYINHINKQINILNRFSRRKDKLLYSSDIPKGIENYDDLVKELEERKAKNRYCIKRKELEDLKSDDYIRKNIGNINVKFPMIDASLFDLEIDGAEPTSKIKIKGNVNVGKLRNSISVIFGMVIFSMFITSFRLELSKEQFASQMEAFWHYFLKCVEDVGVILWQTIRGMFSCRRIISSELTQPYVGRNKVLEAYYRWQKESDIITQDQLDIIVNLERPDDEYIELSEEELKNIKNKQ